MDIEEIKANVRANQYVYTHHAEIERRADELTFAQVEGALSTFHTRQSSLTPGHEEEKTMRKVRCNFCGSDRYEERRIEYLYITKVSTC